MNKFIVGLILFVSILNAQNRYPLLTEYKLVHACIDERTSGGVTRVLRDRCIKRVEYLEKKYDESYIKSLDIEGKLKEQFRD